MEKSVEKETSISLENFSDNDLLRIGANLAECTMEEGIGGPFGAVVVDDSGEERDILSIASNTVLRDNDPTCHAEMNAIREACRVKGTHDLSGCTIYATGSPCPMCLSAIIWSNIKNVVISGLPEDVDAIGFRDEFIFNYIENGCKDESVLNFERADRRIATNLYAQYAKMGQIY